MTPEARDGLEMISALFQIGMYVFIFGWMIFIAMRLTDIRDSLRGGAPRKKKEIIKNIESERAEQRESREADEPMTVSRIGIIVGAILLVGIVLFVILK